MNIDRFAAEVHELVNPTARSKGYDDKLVELVRDCVADHPMKHALGEIIYKVVRYSHRGQVDDILKVGAWAALVFECHPRVEVESASPKRPSGSGPLPGRGDFTINKKSDIQPASGGWPGDRGE